MGAEKKLEHLKRVLEEKGSVAVAFSGGVDSAFLLDVAREVLGDQVLAVTVDAVCFPEGETEEAAAFCRERKIRQELIRVDQLAVPGFTANPPDRCYLCKKAIFGAICGCAEEAGAACVAEGSNADDAGDYRPGLKAIEEMGIRSPLKEADLTKAEIRSLSKKRGLPTWNKRSFACLATRFPYGQTITEEGLGMVGAAEEYLLGLGLEQVRVRAHEKLARIEVYPEDLQQVTAQGAQIQKKLKELGFTYVTVDLGGYRSGSMNDLLPGKKGE